MHLSLILAQLSYGPYINPWKLLAVVVVLLAWAKLLTWMDKDADDAHLPRLALNTALLLTIAAEMVAAREGLGAMIWLAWETLRTEYLFAGLVVMSALGISFNRLLLWLARRAAPWQVERREP